MSYYTCRDLGHKSMRPTHGRSVDLFSIYIQANEVPSGGSIERHCEELLSKLCEFGSPGLSEE